MTTNYLKQPYLENSAKNPSRFFCREILPHLNVSKEMMKAGGLSRLQFTSVQKPGTVNLPEQLSLMIFNSIEPKMINVGVEDELDRLAKQLFLQTQESRMTEIAEILGKHDECNRMILRKYMDHFNFTGMRLEQAFRYFCSHLLLHGESQVIDRILFAFSERYWICNQDRNIPDCDVLHTIVYSILLLNTDLHVAQNHNKISKNDFVKNTLATLKSTNRMSKDHGSFSEVSSLSSTHTHNDIEQESSHFRSIKTSFRDETLTELLKEMYSSIKHTPVPQPISTPSSKYSTTSSFGGFKFQRSKSSSKLSRTKKRNNSLCSNPSSINEEASCRNSTQLSHSIEYSDYAGSYTERGEDILTRNGVTLSTIDEENVRYTKLGHVARKHLFEKTGKKAPNRQWRDCFIIVDKGEFRMYKAEKSGKLVSEVLEECNSQLGRLCLRHTLASCLPCPGHSPSRPYVFALQLSHGGVYLFQVRNSEEAQEWVKICNFWAARESKELLSGAVSNLDYGWGADRPSWSKGNNISKAPKGSVVTNPQFADIILHDWTEPSNPMVQSGLDMMQQYQSLTKHVGELEYELETHMSLRSALQMRFATNSSNMAKAFFNWERKSQYILHELIKYQTYVECLRGETLADIKPDLSDKNGMLEID